MSKFGKGLAKCLPVFVSLALLFLLVQPSAATIPTHGCTPGFWKNHLTAWVEFTPMDSIGAVLEAADHGLGSWVWPACLGSLYSDSLLQVLNYHGGPGLEGGARIFLRQAVAALLNASHPNVNSFDVQTIIHGMRLVLQLCDRDLFLYYGGFYEAYNELGCPNLNSRDLRGRRR